MPLHDWAKSKHFDLWGCMSCGLLVYVVSEWIDDPHDSDSWREREKVPLIFGGARNNQVPHATCEEDIVVGVMES